MAMYGWASVDMLQWVKDFEGSAPQDLPSRGIRPWLSNGLILAFVLYGGEEEHEHSKHALFFFSCFFCVRNL